MAISQIENQNLGKFLQIVFSDGVRNQISEEIADWEYIAKNRQGDSNGRELRFFFQKAFGPSAIQWSGINPAGSFPASQEITVSEQVALYKEINATVEIEYNLWDRARMSPAKYAEPLAIEIQSKATASKRRMSIDLYGSGTGIVGTVASAAASTAPTGNLDVTLSTSNTAEGSIGGFEFGDKLVCVANTAAGSLAGLSGSYHVPTVSSGTVAYLKVEAKNRLTGVAQLSAWDSSNVQLVVTGAGTVASTDVLYRSAQPTIVATNAAVAVDYNTITEVMAGLESLCAADGRLIHGITMSGSTAGTRYDCGNAAIDSSHLQRAMSLVKAIVGQGKYAYKMANMAPETLDSFIESRETDRRFMSITDNKRGLSKFVYVHGTDNIEMNQSEFCPKKRMYILPEAKSNKDKVMELWGSDFHAVRPGGQGSEFFLKPASGGGHDRFIRSYLAGIFTLVAKHPAAIVTLHNFLSAY
jgi:hypothetical protein